MEAATTLDELSDLTFDLRDHYEIQHVVYHWVNGDGQQYGAGTYPIEWAERYVDRGYLRIDPVILGCFQRIHPVEWKELDWSTKSARALMEDAMNYGLGRQGYSVPLRGPAGQFALLTVNDSCNDEVWAKFCADNARDLMLIAQIFNQKAQEFESSAEASETRKLSPREVEALTLLALGYPRARIAQTLAISEHTLRVYVESARHKLGALNTTHAVARALSHGLIVV